MYLLIFISNLEIYISSLEIELSRSFGRFYTDIHMFFSEETTNFVDCNKRYRMMDILLIILGALCLLTGLAGCILPMLPGPPLAYAGLLLLHFTERVQFSVAQLLVWLGIVVVIQVLDYFVPLLGAKYSGSSKWGTRGCLVGTVVGLFFMPWGIILGPFLGAVIGELLGGRQAGEAMKSGLGSVLGFLLGTVLKCAVCGYFIWLFITALL